MIEFPRGENSLILDLGCNRGYFTRVLSSKAITIGLDVNKHVLVEAKRSIDRSMDDNIGFILSDISFLPFRNDSFDVVICASVLEHIENLNSAIKQIKNIIKNNGILIAGYPIYRTFLRAMIRLLNPKGEIIMDPEKARVFFGNKNWKKEPGTHKQDFSSIRETLKRHFLLIKKDKIPLMILGDSLSVYECVKMLKK